MMKTRKSRLVGAWTSIQSKANILVEQTIKKQSEMLFVRGSPSAAESPSLLYWLTNLGDSVVLISPQAPS